MDEVELYKQMLTRDPTSQAFVYLAEAFFERKMYGEAIETCVNGLRLTPHNLRARVVLGLSYLQTDQLDRAETELLKAKEMLEINAVAYNALADLYDKKGAPEQAAWYRTLFQRLHPPETDAEGVEPAAQGEPEPEEEEEPEVATVTMAELYVQQGQLEKAAAVYRRILETAPGTVGV
jgi:tetratricopeptide (TPR) repeat protein